MLIVRVAQRISEVICVIQERLLNTGYAPLRKGELSETCWRAKDRGLPAIGVPRDTGFGEEMRVSKGPGAGFSSADISSIKLQQPVLRGLVSRLGDHSRAVPGQQRSLLPSRLVGWAGHQQ